MSIKHTANITQHLNSMDHFLSKYNHLSDKGTPSTPQFISVPKNIDNINPVKETSTSFSGNKVGVK